MILVAVFILGMPSFFISMEKTEIIDEVAQAIAHNKFSQSTIDPQLLALTPPPPLTSSEEDVMACSHKLNSPAIPTDIDIAYAGCLSQFSLSTQSRKKSRAELTDLFNLVLDLLSYNDDQSEILINTFNEKIKSSHGYKDIQHRRSRRDKEVKKGASIPLALKKMIKKDQKDLWLSFKFRKQKSK